MNEDLYQHTQPQLVGNDMRMLISNMSGRASVQIKSDQLGLDLGDTLSAGIVIGHRPFIGLDTGFRGECAGGLVIAGVIGRDLIAGLFQRL